jgi:hypothetical protein
MGADLVPRPKIICLGIRHNEATQNEKQVNPKIPVEEKLLSNNAAVRHVEREMIRHHENGRATPKPREATNLGFSGPRGHSRA